jgi:hypothetical protein
MRVSGKNILDENGNPWVGRGYNYFEGACWQPGDFAADAAVGCNAVRFGARCWGNYVAPRFDIAQSGPYADIAPAWLQDLIQQCVLAKAAGLKVIFCIESNCGQGNGDPTYCQLWDGSAFQTGQSYFSALGQAQQVPILLNRVRLLARLLRGLVDIVEPGVEMNPPSGLQSDINNLYVQVMNAWLAEDPVMIFMIGGVSYRTANIGDIMAQGTVWPTDQLVLTADLLDNAMKNSFVASLGAMTTVRTATGYPVLSQQVGTSYNDTGAGPDFTGSIYATNVAAMRTATGGSVGCICWEKVGKTAGGYAPWYDPTNNGTGRVLATGGVTRLNAIQGQFSQTWTAAS